MNFFSIEIGLNTVVEDVALQKTWDHEYQLVTKETPPSRHSIKIDQVELMRWGFGPKLKFTPELHNYT